MKSAINSIKMLLIMVVLTGIIYPSFITLTGKLFFNRKVNGTLIEVNGKTIGSELIGQNFTDSKYFVGRPSASNYDTLASGASNKAVTNKEFQAFIKKTYEDLSVKYKTKDIPKELYTMSGSGLDPHISKEGALIQVYSVATERSFSKEKTEALKNLVEELTEKRTFGVLGEERINVLKLNIELDKLALE